MTSKKNYRLIWFQHFHKAAGTSIVDLARANNETFWPEHENGNPKDSDDNFIEIWRYSQDELRQFIDQCEERGVTFVATEWGLPDVAFISQDDRVKLITCLRKPLDRLVSNYFYDLHYEYTQAQRIEDYVDSYKENYRGTYTMFNYYVRMLSRLDNSTSVVNEEHFLKARKALAEFDLCLVVEHGFSGLENGLDWRVSPMHSNRSGLSFKDALSLLRLGKIKDFLSVIQHRKRKMSSGFLNKFKAENIWDIRLYDEINKRAARNHKM